VNSVKAWIKMIAMTTVKEMEDFMANNKPFLFFFSKVSKEIFRSVGEIGESFIS
jgi:hypothetical protein